MSKYICLFSQGYLRNTWSGTVNRKQKGHVTSVEFFQQILDFVGVIVYIEDFNLLELIYYGIK